MRLLLQEPIQVIHFHDLMLYYGRVLSVQLYDRSFLSNFGQFFHASSFIFFICLFYHNIFILDTPRKSAQNPEDPPQKSNAALP